MRSPAPTYPPSAPGRPWRAAAIDWLTRTGANVLVPLFHSPDYDLVADYGDELLRVQVKTSTFFRNGRFEVCLCTAGGNRSWSGLVKRFDPSRYDLLFVLVEGGRRWCIPSEAIGGSTSILVGGPKYAAYELGSESSLGRL